MAPDHQPRSTDTETCIQLAEDRAHDRERHPLLHRLQWLWQTMTITMGWRCSRTMQMTQPQRDVCNQTQPTWNVAEKDGRASIYHQSCLMRTTCPVKIESIPQKLRQRSYRVQAGADNGTQQSSNASPLMTSKTELREPKWLAKSTECCRPAQQQLAPL